MSNEDQLNSVNDKQLHTKADRYVVKDYHRFTQDKLIEFGEKVVLTSGKVPKLEVLVKVVNEKMQNFVGAQTTYNASKNLHNHDAQEIALNHFILALDELADEINHISRALEFLSNTGFNLNKDSHAKRLPDLVQGIKLVDITQVETLKFKIIMPPKSYHTGFQIKLHREDGFDETLTRSKTMIVLNGLHSGKSYTISAAAFTPASQDMNEYHYCQPIKVIVQ